MEVTVTTTSWKTSKHDTDNISKQIPTPMIKLYSVSQKK